MKFTLAQINEVVKGEIVGDPQTLITGISGIKEAKDGDITFLANSKYESLIAETKASAIITSRETRDCSKPLIKTLDPSVSFAKVLDLVSPTMNYHPRGIHKAAVIDPTAVIGKNVSIGANAIVEANVEIGEGTVIYGNCFIGYGTKIGENCLIYSQVSIREKTQIGSRVIIHCGTVIGSDGFGFATVDGLQQKIPQIGIVLIEDDVEIGANVTVDRARFHKTIIGKGTKIDNLVQIAHNVIIGENCLIVAQAGISGSTVLGNSVILAGQSGVVGHIRIGDGAIITAKGGVTKSVDANSKISGYPARPHSEYQRIQACLHRLPDISKRIKELEKKINILELKLKEKNAHSENNQR
ncbi:MAG: UDP-3-O-(3-hydroxymyristoyl)glucosamine N-acyltransferase [Candidatus Omnitrophica bacterium]|nr:UDP-3-O-(3-hydroxymyristoyl)glucosamine N-acyltransferase [Candidatus Omnitrophota bacterium]